MKMRYEQIVEDMESAMLQAHIHSSKKLPSVRDLCAQYNCSKSTVMKAFDVLKSRHLVYSVPQSGYYMVEDLYRNRTTPASVIDFSTGNPIIGKIHTPDLKHCLDRAVDMYSNNSLNHALHGVDSLRNMLPGYLADFQVFTPVDNLFINLGIQQVLSLLSQMPFPNGKDLILIEQPTYRYYIDFLKFFNIDAIGIRRDEKGIDLNRLEALFKSKRIKFFYTVPRNHNPLGTSYNTNQRKAIAQLAAKYDVYIVEDDYFADVAFDSRYDPIFSYGDHCHHIYLRSFTKIMPWIRIGLSIIPTPLLATFKHHIMYSYFYSYFSASLVSQATLEIYIKSNILKKHINAIKKEHLERLKCLEMNLSRLQSDKITCIGGKSGFYSYIKLPAHMNETQFAAALRKENILVAPGESYYLDNAFVEKGIRLSIANTSTADINKGFDIIASTLEKYI